MKFKIVMNAKKIVLSYNNIGIKGCDKCKFHLISNKFVI